MQLKQLACTPSGPHVQSLRKIISVRSSILVVQARPISFCTATKKECFYILYPTFCIFVLADFSQLVHGYAYRSRVVKNIESNFYH